MIFFKTQAAISEVQHSFIILSQNDSSSNVVANNCLACLCRNLTGIFSISAQYALFCAFIFAAKIFAHSIAVGINVKNFLSKRSERNNSGGRQLISFDVAKTKHAADFSCIHVRNLPNIRRPTPPSLDEDPWAEPENAFSISSIQSTHGAICSAIARALIILCSDSPIIPPNKAPISSDISGIFNIVDAVLAINDLPDPGIPEISTPLGISICCLLANSGSSNIAFLAYNHLVILSNPATPDMVDFSHFRP